MTIHCAITYVGENGLGVLVGADGNARTADSSQDSSFQVDKSFRGKKTVGFIRGHASVEGSDPRTALNSALRSLDGCFDDIEEGIDYSTIPVLAESSGYTLLIAKLDETVPSLFTISNMRETDNHVAKRVYPKSEEGNGHSLIFYAAMTRDYAVISSDKQYNADYALRVLQQLLTVPDEESRAILLLDSAYDPGMPTIYRVDKSGIALVR